MRSATRESRRSRSSSRSRSNSLRRAVASSSGAARLPDGEGRGDGGERQEPRLDRDRYVHVDRSLCATAGSLTGASCRSRRPGPTPDISCARCRLMFAEGDARDWAVQDDLVVCSNCLAPADLLAASSHRHPDGGAAHRRRAVLSALTLRQQFRASRRRDDRLGPVERRAGGGRMIRAGFEVAP